jgi:hypothetical protein
VGGQLLAQAHQRDRAIAKRGKARTGPAARARRLCHGVSTCCPSPGLMRGALAAARRGAVHNHQPRRPPALMIALARFSVAGPDASNGGSAAPVSTPAPPAIAMERVAGTPCMSQRGREVRKVAQRRVRGQAGGGPDASSSGHSEGGGGTRGSLLAGRRSSAPPTYEARRQQRGRARGGAAGGDRGGGRTAHAQTGSRQAQCDNRRSGAPPARAPC